MMVGKLPTILQDMVDAWPLILGTIAGIGWIGKRQRQWTKEHISDPIAEVQRRQEQTGTEVSATAHLVRYHLGPNGTTKPLHHRVSNIEKANGIDTTPRNDWPEDEDT